MSCVFGNRARPHVLRRPLWSLALVLAAATAAAPQETVPPAPVAPAVITRDTDGRATLRAVRVDTPLKLDGRLDEPVYRTVPAMTGFIQAEPNVGAPETEKTELWVLFDRDALYVTFRCWDSHPERDVANEMRRDGMSISQNEHVSFILDTFHDKRSMYVFNANSLGARLDGQMTNETTFNLDFNPVWQVAPGKFDGGWTIEMAVPFKSLRYRAGTAQTWGFNARRSVRWKNEISHIIPMPAKGLNALSITSLAPTLVGVEAPPQGRTLEIKPYAIGSLSSDLTVNPRVRNDPSADAGLDVKYGLTRGLTADLTYNTDFAQVEADEAQVNLTRFSLFFPEKREFFLENSGIFAFGGASSSGGSDTPVLFYSRRIGLNGAREVPLLGGGRVTGRVGRFELGALDLRSRADDATGAPAVNFLVGRIRRDLLRKSNIGALLSRRSITQSGTGARDAYGLDGNFNFFDNLYVNTYWARTPAAGVAGGDTSYRVQVDYSADRYTAQLEHLLVGARFTPDMGFVRRPDMRKSSGLFRFSPRTAKSRRVRKLSYTGSSSYIASTAGRLETRTLAGDFAMDFHSSDRLSASVTQSYEFLPRPFRIAPDVVLPVAGYTFSSVRGGYTFGQQRRLSGGLSLERGQFYDGHRTVLGVSGGRVELTPQFSLQPTLSVNWVTLPAGAFRTTVGGSRITYTLTPLMFVSALLQYNSSGNSVAANVRMRWEYRPGSEMFVVYNEQRDTLAAGFPALANRSFVVKINTLLRF